MELANINLNLYKCFIAVYEARGYTKAMEILKMARNNVKLNIEALEEHLEAKLFMGHPRGVVPTSEAEKLYPIAKQAVDMLVNAENNFKNFTNESEAIIRMVIPMTMIGTCLADFFKNFKAKYPNIKFVFENRAQQENYNEFILGNVDIIIDIDEICKNQGLKTFELVTFNLIFIASKNFLSENGLNRIMSMKELQNLSIIGHRANIKSIIGETGLSFTPYMETVAYEPIYPQVKLGAGVGIYAREYLKNQIDNSDIFELNITDIDNIPKVKMGCAYNQKTISKAGQLFIDELKIFFAKEN